MGLSTAFVGEVFVTPPLNQFESSYLRLFNQSRHMTSALGPYDVSNLELHDPRVLDYNEPGDGQPQLWCPWTVRAGGRTLKWDEHEKAYAAEEWLEYLIDHFLKPGALASGQERFSDFTFDHLCQGRVVAIPLHCNGVFAPRVIEVVDNRVSSTEEVLVWHSCDYERLTCQRLREADLSLESIVVDLLSKGETSSDQLEQLLDIVESPTAADISQLVEKLRRSEG